MEDRDTIPVIVVTDELKALIADTDTASMSEEEFEVWLMGLASGELPMWVLDSMNEEDS